MAKTGGKIHILPLAFFPSLRYTFANAFGGRSRRRHRTLTGRTPLPKTHRGD